MKGKEQCPCDVVLLDGICLSGDGYRQYFTENWHRFINEIKFGYSCRPRSTEPAGRNRQGKTQLTRSWTGAIATSFCDTITWKGEENLWCGCVLWGRTLLLCPSRIGVGVEVGIGAIWSGRSLSLSRSDIFRSESESKPLSLKFVDSGALPTYNIAFY